MRALPEELAGKIDSVAPVIAERGLDDTTMEDLAKAAGIPRATLYYYFSGKEEILSYLLSELLSRLADDVLHATRAGGTAAERLAEVIRIQLTVMADRADVCTVLIGNLGRAARMPQVTAMAEHAFIDPVRQLIEEGAADGSLVAVDDPQVASAAVFGAITSTALSFLIRQRTIAAGPAGDILVDLIVGGIKAPEPGLTSQPAETWQDPVR